MTFVHVTVAVFSPGSVELDLLDGQETCGASVSDYDINNNNAMKNTIEHVQDDTGSGIAYHALNKNEVNDNIHCVKENDLS